MADSSNSQDTSPTPMDQESSVPTSSLDLSNLDWVHQRLKASFPLARIQVQDTRGDDQHLSVTIMSSDFKDKPRIACHQMVYAVLDHMRNNQIHALALRTAIE